MLKQYLDTNCHKNDTSDDLRFLLVTGPKEIADNHA